MSRRLIVRREAEEDITAAALWYEDREAGLGLELTLEIRAGIRRTTALSFEQWLRKTSWVKSLVRINFTSSPGAECL